MNRIGICVVLTAVTVSLSATAREMPLPRWDWVISGPVDVRQIIAGRPFDFVGLDGFETAAETVDAFHVAGVQVWCYISAGTIEDWRPDYDAFTAADATRVAAGEEPLIGHEYVEWPGEYWLNPRAATALMPLIHARLAMCADKGFDMVEFDNMDGYDNETGLEISRADAVAFAIALSEAAEVHGLAPILKNTPELAQELEPWFAAYLLEDCALNATCDSAAPFAAANKPVFNAEYPENYADAGLHFDLDAVCLTGESADVSMLVKALELDMERTLCP